VGAAVGLDVQAVNLDDPHRRDAGWEQVDLCSDEVGVSVRLGPRQKGDPDGARPRDLRVDSLLDLTDELPAQALKFKIHAAAQQLHVAPGDLGTVVAPHDAAEDMKRGVSPHQGIAAIPIELATEQAGVG
jgi:hypothetical protein